MKKQIGDENGLWKNPRSKNLWFRRAVPKELQILIGKTEIRKSLRTPNIRIAESLARREWQNTEAAFENARFGRKTDTILPSELSGDEVSNEELVEVTKWWREIYRKTGEASGEYDHRNAKSRDEIIDDIAAHSDQSSEWLETGDFSYMFGIARDVLKRRIPDKNASDETVKLLARLLVEAERDVYGFKSAVLRGEVPDLERLHRDPAWTILTQKKLSDLLDEYLQDRKPPSQTEAEWRLYFRRLIEVIGDKPIHKTVQKDIRNFRQSMEDFPSRLTNEMRKWPVPKLVEFARQAEIQCLSNETVRKHINAISSVFSWAVRDGQLPFNPASGQGPRRIAKDDEVEPYQAEDLRELFQKDRYLKNRVRVDDFWLPLVALYSGARREEIAQLHVDDIRAIKNVLCMHIRPEYEDEETKSVKVQSSIRRVPLHKALLNAGFMDFVNERRASGNTNLFPERVRNKHGKLGTQFGKRFLTFRRSVCGIVNPKLVFHSLRHTFKDACADAGMSARDSDKLTGHSPMSVGARYGQGTSLAILKERLDQIEYPTVPQFHWSEFRGKM